ncbi:hypothetical protein T492DRAFT_536511 [Pavlovales sp. CCMP2436]|nr:hypothetical protein T492DRAFT_536511 [Pavlovales sp. CCMP2436]
MCPPLICALCPRAPAMTRPPLRRATLCAEPFTRRLTAGSRRLRSSGSRPKSLTMRSARRWARFTRTLTSSSTGPVPSATCSRSPTRAGCTPSVSALHALATSSTWTCSSRRICSSSTRATASTSFTTDCVNTLLLAPSLTSSSQHGRQSSTPPCGAAGSLTGGGGVLLFRLR